MSLRAFAEGVAISVGQVALLEEIAASINSFLPRDDSYPDITKWNRYKIESANHGVLKSAKGHDCRRGMYFLRPRRTHTMMQALFHGTDRRSGLPLSIPKRKGSARTWTLPSC